MPWKPSAAGQVRDPRLDPYRNRVAAVRSDDGQLCGHLFVKTDFMHEQVGGHLWWRRWSAPEEFAVCYLNAADADSPLPEFTDFWVTPDALDDELADWAAARMTYVGETYALSWLSAEESAQLRREHGYAYEGS